MNPVANGDPAAYGDHIADVYDQWHGGRDPVGPVVEAEIQRVARAMGQTGILGREDATEAEQRALVSSMTGPGS